MEGDQFLPILCGRPDMDNPKPCSLSLPQNSDSMVKFVETAALPNWKWLLQNLAVFSSAERHAVVPSYMYILIHLLHIFLLISAEEVDGR